MTHNNYLLQKKSKNKSIQLLCTRNSYKKKMLFIFLNITSPHIMQFDETLQNDDKQCKFFALLSGRLG